MHNCLIQPLFSETCLTYGCMNTDCTFKAEFVKTKFVITTPHSCFVVEHAEPSNIMQYGNVITLSFSFDELFEIVLVEGGRYDSRYGSFPHASFVGKSFGTKIQNSRSNGFVIPLQF